MALFAMFNNNHLFKPRFYDPIHSNFSFAGPCNLDKIIELDLGKDKSTAAILDTWMTCHKGKEEVHDSVLSNPMARVLKSKINSPFFMHPVFQDDNNLVSQFQSSNHFLLAFLEEYQMDPAQPQPLLTISVFDGIEEDEGYKLFKCLINNYSKNEEFESVHTFHKKPESFDLNGFIKEKEKYWINANDGTGGSNVAETSEKEK
ncbi:hypothetical protein ACHAXS_013253 [Conticribra weissflogii]